MISKIKILFSICLIIGSLSLMAQDDNIEKQLEEVDAKIEKLDEQKRIIELENEIEKIHEAQEEQESMLEIKKDIVDSRENVLNNWLWIVSIFVALIGIGLPIAIIIIGRRINNKIKEQDDEIKAFSKSAEDEVDRIIKKRCEAEQMIDDFKTNDVGKFKRYAEEILDKLMQKHQKNILNEIRKDEKNSIKSIKDDLQTDIKNYVDELEERKKEESYTAEDWFIKGWEAGKEKDHKKAIEYYKKAIEKNPNYYDALNNWGINLGNFAKTKEGKETEELYNQAFEKFQKAIEIKADFHEAFNNWGVYLGNFAKTKEGKEAEELYNQAFVKFQKAIEIKADNHEAFNNWGIDLGNFAKTKEGEKAEEIYKEAFEKFQKASEIKSDKYETFNNWGTMLILLAKTKEGKEAEKLHNEAFDKFKKAFDLGGKAYNLACAYALKKDKENALKYLKISLEKDEVTINYVKNEDEDWEAYRKDKDFKVLIENFKKE